MPADDEVQPGRESEGETDPYGGPNARLFRAHLVRVPMKHAEVEREHDEHERDEADPEPDVHRNHVARKLPRTPRAVRSESGRRAVSVGLGTRAQAHVQTLPVRA